MATFQTKCFADVKPLVLPDSAKPEWIAVDVEFSATAYASADIIKVCKMPEGYRVLDWALVFPDIDTGTAAIAWSFGVSNATILLPVGTDIGSSLQIWGAALTAGQAVAPVRNASTNCAQDAIKSTSTIPGDREIILKCTTIAATYAGSGKTGQVLMLVQA